MEVTLTLEIPANSREELQRIIDTVTTYDLIDMATCISDTIEPEEPEPSDAAQMELLESWFPWIGTDGVVGGADIVDRLNEWYEAVGGEFNPEAEDENDE